MVRTDIGAGGDLSYGAARTGPPGWSAQVWAAGESFGFLGAVDVDLAVRFEHGAVEFEHRTVEFEHGAVQLQHDHGSVEFEHDHRAVGFQHDHGAVDLDHYAVVRGERAVERHRV